MRKFLSEIFQDTDGGASMKRFAFFIFVFFFIALSAGVVLHGLDQSVIGFANSTLEKVTDIIKWLGAYILADKTPAVVKAFSGAPSREKSTITTETVTGPTGG